MRVLVVGATGLIGYAVVGRLRRESMDIVGVAREVGAAARQRPDVDWRPSDLATADAAAWTELLHGAYAVVNCAGALQHGPSDDLDGVHVRGLATLIEACREAGVRRFVHISAIGADSAATTAFSRTKHVGDGLLRDSALDWVILRPALVLGRAAFGGSALLRALAALPVQLVAPDAGRVQVVQVEDVADAVCFFLAPGAPSRVSLDLAAPDVFTVEEIAARYRAWLGRPPAWRIHLPAGVQAVAWRLGDFAGLLGWRPPMRSTAGSEIHRGVVADDADAWPTLSGRQPRRFADALADSPASVQEQWFANLYLLKAVIVAILAAFWIVTGLVTIGPAYRAGVDLLREAGAGGLASPLAVAGGIADILIGIGIAFRRTARLALLAAIALSLLYVLAGALLVPRLWIDPLGPLLKILPIMALHMVALAILRSR